MSLILGSIAAVTIGTRAFKGYLSRENYALGCDLLGAAVEERREPPVVSVRGGFWTSVAAGLTVAGILLVGNQVYRGVVR